jgi:hypothetical protein
MVKRWFLEYQSYDIDWEYIKGEDNEIADCLSRLCPNTSLSTPQEILSASEELERVNNHKWELMKKCHNDVAGHHGAERMKQKLDKVDGGIWPKRDAHIARFIKRCPCCQKMSRLKYPIHATPFTLSSYSPMSTIAIDAIEGLRPDNHKNNTIIVIIDTFSRFIELYPTDGIYGAAVSKALLAHIGRYGIPDQIRSDRGPAFTSIAWEELVKLIGIDHALTTAYSKEENGIVERANQEVMRHLRNIVFDKNILDKWSVYLPLVQRICNSSVHWSTGVTPASIIFGNAIDLDRQIIQPSMGDNGQANSEHVSYLDPSNLGSWMAQMLQNQDNIIQLVAKNLRQRDEIHLRIREPKDKTEFPIGSYVLSEYTNAYRKGPSSKLLPFLEGPLRVVNIKNSNTYVVQNLVTLRTYDINITRLRPFDFDPLTQNPLQMAIRDHTDLQEVARISDMKGNPKGRKTNLTFLVHWIGFAEPTWEPWKNVRNTTALVNFLRTHDDPVVRKLTPKDLEDEETKDN